MSDQTRDRLLSAAKVCYETKGIAKTTMEDIGRQAELTRRTVYRYFASATEILDAVVLKEANSFIQQMQSDLAHIKTFEDYVVESMLYTIKHAPNTSTHSFLFGEDILPIVNRMYITEGFIGHAAEGLKSIWCNYGGDPEEMDFQMLSEWINRLSISFLSTPSPSYHSEQELRSIFIKMLKPILS